MVSISRRSLATTFLVLITVLIAATANAEFHALKDRLSRLEEGSQKNTRAGNAFEAIRAFYSQRDHRPLWLEDSRLSPRAKALLNALANAADHGLNPGTYGAQTLAERASRTEAAQMPELELALTLAYLNYVGDVSSGVIDNPRNRGGNARDAKRSPAAKWLEDIANANDFAMFFDRLPPGTRSYRQLRAALAKYREIEKAGGWPTVDKGPRLKPGMAGARVAQIKRRLVLTGELDAEGDAELFDDGLVVAVKKFQLRHGLDDDGNVGAETVAEMNVPVRVRIEQIVINLERHRWLGAHLGDRYIHVNVANNGLKIIEKDQTIHVARVIVGKPLHETPVFSASVTYIEINPYWNVPHGIAVNELLPKIKSNPGFLAANGYLLLGRSGDNSSAINPASVDWSMITPHYFPYFLRQKPGPHNALGTIAFMFPNPHNVFIHDTPGKSLFNLAERYFSHGCIRVQFPMKLAILLLAGQDGGRWNEGRIRSVVETNEQTRVELKNPIPVHITYFTAWADADGTVHFRKDPYRRDGTLKRAIEQIAQAK